jgi:ribosomal protein S18 acetylase RimI-like enzyme
MGHSRHTSSPPKAIAPRLRTIGQLGLCPCCPVSLKLRTFFARGYVGWSTKWQVMGPRMTDEITVRDARFNENRFIMEMTRFMVCEMERYGGRQATTDESAWNAHALRLAAELNADNFKYLIAEAADSKRIGLGGARISTPEGVLAPKKIIHISVLYVLPSFRQTGVASKLISQMLDWGRHVGGDYFDLNVAVGNPARSLYQKFGFSDAAINMTRPILAS